MHSPDRDRDELATGATEAPVESGMTLFRLDALERPQSTLGRVAPLTPPSWRWMTIGLVAVIATAIVFLLAASFARKETVAGRLRPVAGEFRVIAGRGGTVQALFVKEGALVRRGEPLLVLSMETVLGSGATTNARLMQSVRDERMALQQRVENASQAADLEVRDSRLLELTLNRQAAALSQQRLKVERRLTLAEDQFEAIKSLREKGYARSTELKAREDAKLSLEQNLIAMDSQHNQLLVQAQQARAAALRAMAEARKEQNTLQESLAALAQREVEAELQGSVLMRAAVSGRVTAVRAAPGKVLNQNQPIMTILASPRAAPRNAETELLADLYVPPRAIGFVRAGQPVRLMIDAFPYQQFGTVAGRVQSVSRTALAPEELDAVENDVNGPVYVITASLDADSLAQFGRRDEFSPGMTLSADIILEERSLLDWLFGPLIASGRRIF